MRDVYECDDAADERAPHHLPTRLLTPPHAPLRPHHGLSGALPRLPRTSFEPRPKSAETDARQQIQRRRRLLAIFSRMMARFYDHHERRLSGGRWECSLCGRKIVAWAWAAPVAGEIVHEACVNRSMWDVVISYEYVARAGYAPDVADFTLMPWGRDR